METRNSQFNRRLLIVMVVLYLLTIAVFGYPLVASEPDQPWWMIPLNLLILSVPLLLLFGSLYVLGRAGMSAPRSGRSVRAWQKSSTGLPDLAAVLIILFMSLFSLDVFETGACPLEVLGALLMHNIPSLIMIVFLVFAWKRPFIGFAVFLIAAIAFAIFFVRDMYVLPNLVLFVLPILLIASLFYADWKWLKPSGSA